MQSCGLCLRCAQGWSFLQRLTNADVRAAGGKWCADLQLLPCAVHGMPRRSILQAETCSVTVACRAHQQVDDWLDQGSGFQPAVGCASRCPTNAGGQSHPAMQGGLHGRSFHGPNSSMAAQVGQEQSVTVVRAAVPPFPYRQQMSAKAASLKAGWGRGDSHRTAGSQYSDCFQ